MIDTQKERRQGVPVDSVVVRTTKLQAAADSHAGRVRSGNEDRLYVDAERGIFLVVDGVGGHASGEVAAAIATTVISEYLLRPGPYSERRVREAIALANNEIHRQAAAAPEHHGMACVLTLALVSDGRLLIGHVGDTRLYRIAGGEFAKLTHDHSPVGEREDSLEISEVEAMHHPRRNEVFRDVGTTLRQPDDAEFIEIIETAWDERSALLLCSDGLTDMVASTAIERLVRQHAGNPAAVVQALIAAANDAGGRDNITAVYVEGASFARVASRRARRRLGPATAAALGAVAGLAAGLAAILVFDLSLPASGGRTLVVGATGGYPTIAAALLDARARDVVQVEPGEYIEAVVLPAGVELSARVPGTVTLVAPPRRRGWVGITAGARGSRVSGMRLVGREDAPLAVGLSVAGQDVEIDDVSFEGHIDIGADMRSAGPVTLRASRFWQAGGVPVRISPGGQPTLRQNVFVNVGGSAATAIDLRATAPGRAGREGARGGAELRPNLAGNLFVGYTDPIAAPDSWQAHLMRHNYSIPGSDGPLDERKRP